MREPRFLAGPPCQSCARRRRGNRKYARLFLLAGEASVELSFIFDREERSDMCERSERSLRDVAVFAVALGGRGAGIGTVREPSVGQALKDFVILGATIRLSGLTQTQMSEK